MQFVAEVRSPRAPLTLDYSPRVPMDTIRRLEACARTLGLPLEQLELLGQDVGVAEAFIQACATGEAEAFLEEADWEGLASELAAHGPMLN